MTVGELKERLENLDNDLPVSVEVMEEDQISYEVDAINVDDNNVYFLVGVI